MENKIVYIKVLVSINGVTFDSTIFNKAQFELLMSKPFSLQYFNVHFLLEEDFSSDKFEKLQEFLSCDWLC